MISHGIALYGTICHHANTYGTIKDHLANIAQEQPSIRNMQVVSSNHVYSTHSCEANKCRIFKPFFFVYQIKGF